MSKDRKTRTLKNTDSAERAPQPLVAPVPPRGSESKNEKVARIKKQVAEGTYSTDSREVAEAIINKTLDSSTDD